MLKFVKFFRDNNLKKKAMTLAELLVVFTIMGVIAAMAMHVSKPLDKGLKYSYARVYHTLQTAIYNARTELPQYLAPRTTNCPNGQTLCSADGMDGDWPTSAENFCKMLVEYINFKPCSVKDYGDGVVCNAAGRGNLGSSIPRNQADNNFTIANCHDDLINLGETENSAFNAASIDSTLRSANPHIVASNGVRLWIGGVYNTVQQCVDQNDPDPNSPFSEDDSRHKPGSGTCSTVTTASPVYNAATGTGAMDVRYFIVIADLNGSNRPNTTAWRIDRPADIVAFAVTSTNDVVPLGYPEIDRRYLSARVVYNSRMDQSDALGGTSSAMTLYQAKRHAWAQCKAEENNTVYEWCNEDGGGAINHGMRVNEENILGADLYNHYETAPEGSTTAHIKEPNFSPSSPFYLNADKIREVDASLLNETYNSTFCGRTEMINGQETAVVDQNACYPSIFDYY